MANAQENVNGPRVITPKGTFVFPALITPETFKKATKYKCRITMPKEDRATQQFMADIQKFQAEAEGKMGTKLPNLPWDDDEYTEGNVVFKTACNEDYPPVLKDATGKKDHPKEVPIMNGTQGKLRVRLIGYPGLGGGVSLRLEAAQILELAGHGDCGFDEEDGYRADELENAVVSASGTHDDVAFDGGDDGEPDF